LGNYLGAIKRWVESQDDFSNIFCVVDLHTITIKQNPDALRKRIRETAAMLLAAGIDPKKSEIFIQSHIPAHTELAWILNCFIPMGWMERMTQFKEKSAENKERVSVGLFDYPALMAADILLYGTEIVPVGEDQIQHVELARDVAKKFNVLYGDTFVVPKAVIGETGARIMGLQNPEKKMSKSEGGENNIIYLTDTPEAITKKINSAVTDSGSEINFGKNMAGMKNMLTIYKTLTGQKEHEIEKHFRGKGYAEFKKELSELIAQKLETVRKNYEKIMSKPEKIDAILEKSADKLKPIAEQKLKEVKDKIGLI
jgi:tryptophanyl-tRNA synthetase